MVELAPGFGTIGVEVRAERGLAYVLVYLRNLKSPVVVLVARDLFKLVKLPTCLAAFEFDR